MNINCIICSDMLTPTSDIYTTPCGHIFHYRCLIRWIEKARTCPQCRNKTTEDTIHRIYFNLANTDGIVDNAETLHFKLSSFQSELKLKEKDVEITTRKYNDAKEQTSKLKSLLHDLESERKISASAVEALKGQLEYYKVKSKESDHLCEEITNLKDKLQKFDNVLDVLNEAKEHANEMLRHNKDSESLNILVSTLKKELIESNRKSRQASANLKDTNNSLSCYKKELLEIKQENYKLKFDAEVHNNCTKQQQYLKKKLSDLKTKTATIPCTLNIPDETIIFSESDRSPETHRISKNLNVIDLSESKDSSLIDLTKSKDSSLIDLTKSKELNGINLTSPLNRKYMEKMVRAVSPMKLQDIDLESVGRDSKKDFRNTHEPLNEFKRCRSSSAISKTKFRKLAPNKKLRDYLRNSDE